MSHLELVALVVRALARQLGVSRVTIHRWIRAGDLERDLDLDGEPVRGNRPRPDGSPKPPLLGGLGHLLMRRGHGARLLCGDGEVLREPVAVQCRAR